MKVCIVAFSNLKVTPYLYLYTRILDSINIKYDIVYWDRKNIDEYINCSTYKFTMQLDDSKPIKYKVIFMLKYAGYVKKVIKSQNYDFVIVLTSLLGVLLSGFLVRFYKDRYIFDIRDYSYEHILFYKKQIKKIMANSKLNVISSPGFLNFLPLSNAVLCNNISFDQSKIVFTTNKKQFKNNIRIGFVGAIRYYSECTKFIDAIKNDRRIEFCFFGEGEDENKIRQYCQKNMVTNVKFFGPYIPQKKDTIINSLDIIYNAYGNKSPKVKYALSNKCYDAAWYKKPILVNKNTSMASYTKGYSYVISDNEMNLSDNIYNWYSNINWGDFNKTTESVIERAFLENEFFKNKLVNIFLKLKN